MPAEDDFFAELDAEVAKFLSASDKAKKLEDLRKASNNRFSTAKSRAMSKEEHDRLKAEIEASQWEPEAYYAMFSEQSCSGCGSVHRTFLQYMELQFLLRRPTTKRFHPVAKPGPIAFPRRVMIQPLKTHLCADCCSEHGFNINESEERKTLFEVGTITVNGGYQQDDINQQELEA